MGRLIAGITRTWRGILDARLAPLGLSEARWQCLLHLGRSATPLSQVELADRMGITPPSLVKLLDRLEDDQWLHRVPEPGDRRAKRIELTAKAREMARHIEEEAARLRSELLEGTSIAERKAFMAMLRHLDQRAESLKPGTSPAGEETA
ncbi:MAG TPA: MarR family transcriptional regulator [Moraxellaceae bacterium]|nr:MarR family transcriptional regulator [Moraxellaceae bacterium]